MTGELLLDKRVHSYLFSSRSKSRHPEFVHFFEGWEGPVVSTEAVLTESSHLLGRAPGGVEACLSFFLQGGATLVPSSHAALGRCRELVNRYADLPMDFADATLVALAEELETDLVLTTDRTDFEIYRWDGRDPFRVVLREIGRLQVGEAG